MSKLDAIEIRHSLLSNRILLARFGADKKTCALETRDATSEFYKALVSFAFDGKLPEIGSADEIKFGGDNEQFEVIIKRI